MLLILSVIIIILFLVIECMITPEPILPPCLLCQRCSPGRIERLSCVAVQFLGHVFHPIVVPDGPSGQRVHCGYTPFLSCDDPCLSIVMCFDHTFTSG